MCTCHRDQKQAVKNARELAKVYLDQDKRKPGSPTTRWRMKLMDSLKDSTKSFEMALYFPGACALLSTVITLCATRITQARKALEAQSGRR